MAVIFSVGLDGISSKTVLKASCRVLKEFEIANRIGVSVMQTMQISRRCQNICAGCLVFIVHSLLNKTELQEQE